MDLPGVLRCLAGADADPCRTAPRTGRYLAVVSFPEPLGDGETYRAEDSILYDGEHASLHDALDRLAFHVAELTAEADLEDLLAAFRSELDRGEMGEPGRGPAKQSAWIAGIDSAERRLLAYVLLGAMGPMNLVTEDFADDPYLGAALTHVEDARFVLLASAAPPNQDIALGVLELQPAGNRTAG